MSFNEKNIAVEASKGHDGSKKAKIEKVVNIMGSCAGAGSGEFDLYRAARKRERDRIRGLEESDRLEKEREELSKKIEMNRIEAEERTRKNAEKRKKKKARLAIKKVTSSNEKNNGQENGKEENDKDDESEDPNISLSDSDEK